MSSIMSEVNDIITFLSQRKSAVSCAGKRGLQKFMKDLGFEDSEGNTPGHRVFTHERLSRCSEFISTSIDCGHRPQREMKLAYVVKIIGVLRKYKPELEKFEEEDNA